MSVRLSTAVEGNSGRELPAEDDTRGSVPVLKLAGFFEQVAQQDQHEPPPLVRRRFTRTASEDHLEAKCTDKRRSLEFYEEDDDTPLTLVVDKKAASSSEPVPRFQLDLKPVFEKRDQEVQGRARPAMKRTVSMSSLLSPRNGTVHTARERGATSSFPEVVFSPRTVRSYVPTPINEIKKADISDIPDVKRGTKSFEKGVMRCMQVAWKSSERVKINAVVIEERVRKLCRVEIDRLFHRKDSPLSSELQITESPRAKALIALVQKSGAILFPVIKRLQIFRTAIIEYVGLKGQASPSVRSLISILDNLVVQQRYTDDPSNVGLVKGKDINMFMQTWDAFYGHKAMRPYAKILQAAFGDSKKERKEVMATLRKWVKPPPEILMTLKQKVHRMDWDNISAMNIPFFEHEWQEDSHSKNPISKISPREIARCLHTGVGIPMRRLTINGNLFYDDERDGDKPLPKQEEFIFGVIKHLHLAGLDPEIKDETVREYVDKLMTLMKLKLEEQENLSIDDAFPCINLLRLITNSAWGHADTYMRSLFPDLFKVPFWTKAVQSLEYNVAIADETDYSVQMNRTYAVYHRLIKGDENCYAVDRQKPLVTIRFSWTLSATDEGWAGVLRVDNYEVKPEAGDDKWNILQSLIQYKDQETPKGEVKSPGTPRMRSAPRLSLKKQGSGSRESMIISSSASSSEGSSKGKERMQSSSSTSSSRKSSLSSEKSTAALKSGSSSSLRSYD